ncbi:MAG: hypothetical protein WCL54_06935, partial [Clostridia bacterium]
YLSALAPVRQRPAFTFPPYASVRQRPAFTFPPFAPVRQRPAFTFLHLTFRWFSLLRKPSICDIVGLEKENKKFCSNSLSKRM